MTSRPPSEAKMGEEHFGDREGNQEFGLDMSRISWSIKQFIEV